MDESDFDTVHKTFRLSPEHVEFLESVDKNVSNALRKTIDMLKKRSKKEIIKEGIYVLLIGVVFLFFATLSTNIGIIIVSSFFGLAICVYSLGGMIFEIQRTRRRN